MKKHVLLFMLGAAGIAVLLSGCNSSTPQQSTQQAASFKGGPMPPDARAKMDTALDAAKTKHP